MSPVRGRVARFARMAAETAAIQRDCGFWLRKRFSPGRGWEDVTDIINGNDLGTSNDILVLKKNNNPIIAAWVNHQCTCSSTPTSGSGTASSGSGGGGHMCPHDQILVAETTARWYKKVKTDALK